LGDKAAAMTGNRLVMTCAVPVIWRPHCRENYGDP
jgi:hypothetical protein